MSEEHQHQRVGAHQAGSQKQSFLSKFSRSEVRPSKSIDKYANLTLEQTSNDDANSKSTDQDCPIMSTTINKSTPEIETDKILRQVTANERAGEPRHAGEMSNAPDEADKSRRNEGSCNDSTPDVAKRNQQANDNANGNETHLEDDNDQVLPVWPSKIDAATLEPSMFQVYSLKDYSQVAKPIENVASSTTGGRLLKSMSQDRKVDSRTKRMSECALPNATSALKSTDPARQHRLPSMANLRTMGPATSVNSLLPQSKNSTLMGESRIDRMRKLFVSPLSLRGSTSGKSSQSHQVSSHSRLSLQAGANMLNKPHHLMHAMYRTRVGAGAHYNRRSPMRQKPGSMRSFRVYGCPLSMANTMYPITCFGRPDIYKQQSVPYILARLCCYIEENSSKLTHEGIFRVSGNARLMEKLKTLFDHLGDAPLESESVDVATSASMLKMYLRELPDPLIPTRMNYYFFTLAKKYSTLLTKPSSDGLRATDSNTSTTLANEPSSMSDGQSTLERQRQAFIRDLTKFIRKLPIENYNLLKYLACFLHRISLKQKSNKMSAEALGIVFGPNVFRIRSESYKGLKEQELSNQIMASIIINYKQIFDCELTDALGNIVTSNEFLHRSNREHEERVTKDGDSPDVANIEGKTPSSAFEIDKTSSQPIATPSTSQGSAYKPRCSRRGRHTSYRYAADEHGSGEDVNADGDDEERDFDDDDECDDGSYSQSSDGGSYCSSIASESGESIYEGDGRNDQYNDDGREFAFGSDTASECDSETSYTPSSSHSDTNANEVELSSSNFSSHHSLADANGNDNESNSPRAQKSCLVCKRRESAQIEANRVREQILSATLSTPQSRSSEEVTSERERNSGPVKSERASDPNATSEQNQLAPVKNIARQSTRRKRTHEEPKNLPSTRNDGSSDNGDQAPTHPARSSRHSQNYQSRLEHRRDPMRRRSSSASSVLKVSNRVGQSSRKRGGATEEHNLHRNTRIHSDRRRYNEARGYNRKSRNKGHQARKDGHTGRPHVDHSQQLPPNEPANSLKGHSEWKKGDCYVPELVGMNLPPDEREDLVWNYVSSSYLDVPDCDRFYQLRSYNSDETLLRSQECATRSSVEVATRARRRFSGQDYLNINQENLLANVSSEFQKITENYEDETLDDVADDVATAGLRRLNLMGGSSAVQSSVVSLLGEPMVSFKHSTLSLAGESSDPIVGQLKVLKDLARRLEKLTKIATVSGLNENLSSYISIHVGADLDSEDCFDNISSCCYDYLAAKTIIDGLDAFEEYDKDHAIERFDDDALKHLIDLLTIRIVDLKKRYNNLRYIREHYFEHHSKKKHASGGLSNADQTRASDESSLHLDGQSACSDNSSFGSALNTIGLDTDLKAGQPNTQPTDSTLATSSCKFGLLCPVEFVFNVEKQLSSRRQSGSRLAKLTDMTSAQLQSEKLELQKNLLRYEHWFGRPTTRGEFNLVGHLYERYRAIKIIKQQKSQSS